MHLLIHRTTILNWKSYSVLVNANLVLSFPSLLCLANFVSHSAFGSLVSLKEFWGVCRHCYCFAVRWIKEWLADSFTNPCFTHKKKCKGGVWMGTINRNQGRQATVFTWPIKSLLESKKSEKASPFVWVVPLWLDNKINPTGKFFLPIFYLLLVLLIFQRKLSLNISSTGIFFHSITLRRVIEEGM